MVSAAETLDGRVARAWDVLAGVPDPEVPALSLVDLGVVRGVRATDEGLEVDLTPTYTGCPATAAIALDAATALEREGLGPVRIVMVHAPAWTTDWIGPAAREKLRAYGIAAPVGAAPKGKRALFAADADPACPRCGAARVEKTSEFGSTACKALYRCLACREPFEYFKCI
ncbi:MAG: 1,2-phenylacetyl-CoA epoxidase subunit PaaD [Tagaea sp.]